MSALEPVNLFGYLSPIDEPDPDPLPEERFCPCGNLLIDEEEERWGGCRLCLDGPIDFVLVR